MPMTPFGGYDSDFADQIRRMLQLGGAAPGVQNAGLYNFSNPPPANGPGPGQVAPVPLSSAPAPAPVGNNPYAAAASVPPPAPAPPIAASVAQPQPQPYGGPMAAADAARPPPMGGAYAHMPFPGQRDPAGVFAPRPGAAPAPVPAASSPAATSTAAPAAAPRPQSPNLGYYPPNPRFGTMQSQVPGSGGGPLSRAPIYTTLNLFGGGGGAQPSAARGAIPANATAEVPPNKYPGDEGWDVDAQGNPVPSFGDQTGAAPWGYGPLQKGNIWKRSGGPHSGS